MGNLSVLCMASFSPSRGDLVTFELKSHLLPGPGQCSSSFSPWCLHAKPATLFFPNDKWTGSIKSVKCDTWKQRNDAIVFLIFFGLSLPPLHPVMGIILVFCCNEFSLFLPSFIQAWIHLFTVKSTVIEVEQAHPFHPLVLWSAWVSKGCCDQSPQSWCLKTIEIYSPSSGV